MMDKSIVFALVFIVVSGITYYFYQEHQARQVLSREAQSKAVTIPQPARGGEEKREVRYPVPGPSTSQAGEGQQESETAPVAVPFVLPRLNESDVAMQSVLAGMYEPARLAQIFIFSDFIRHIVVSLDNLTEKKLPRRFIFTQATPGSFSISRSAVENEFLLDPKNFERYRHYIDFSRAIDNRQLVSLYIRYYPLFQEAYDELGYPGRYFNDRVIEIIDHLLLTPEINEPVKLVQPKVYYQFVDPALENLSAGQKILIRMGPDNARLVKRRLTGIREILTTLKP